MTFSEYLVVLRARWRVWTSLLVVGLLAGSVFSALSTVKYTATATTFVTVSDRGDADGELFQSSQFAVQRVKSYASLVESPEVLTPVIDRLELDDSPRELAERTTLTSPPDTVLMELSATDKDPAQARAIADAVALELGSAVEDLETVRAARGPNVKVSLIKPAETPTSASSPRTLLNVALGAVAGLAIGLVVAVLRHRFDRRIKSAESLRHVTGMTPLGVTAFNRAWSRTPLVALDWRSEAAESYRTIRTALKFAAIDTEVRHILITSPEMSEGKTTTACNLAISWAQSGASVCLVEADLRRPRVANYLGIEGNPGLSDVLVGEASLDDVLVPWNRGMLTALPAGSLPPDPGALLGSEAMRSLVKDIGQRFDVLIYDSSPLLPVTDAAILGKHVDGLVLAVRCGSTNREQVTRCAEIAENARVALLGTVLTCVRHRGHKDYQDYTADRSTERPELAPLSSEPRHITTRVDDQSQAVQNA